MSAQNLLDRLECVKQTSADRWIARCPAHDDKSPSLSIRELEDGIRLCRCWAGCEFSEIVAAAGLEPSDLFPEKPLPIGLHGTRGHRKPYPAADILQAVAHEAVFVAVTARDLASGATLTVEAIARLFTVSGRLLSAAEAAGGAA